MGARNNAELLERHDIDAVMIATADFQHAQHGVAAARAGKDAYIEDDKPYRKDMDDRRELFAKRSSFSLLSLSLISTPLPCAKVPWCRPYFAAKTFFNVALAISTSERLHIENASNLC